VTGLSKWWLGRGRGGEAVSEEEVQTGKRRRRRRRRRQSCMR
jgi:hypothetical protein